MKATIALFLLIISPLSIAQIVSGIDYINLQQEVSASTTKFDASVSGIVLVAGYSFAYSDNITITPELAYGTGTSEDERNEIHQDSQFWSVGVRYQF